MLPGVMTPDSFATISFAKGEAELSNLHTVMFALFINYTSFKGELIFLSTLVITLLNVIALYAVVNMFFKSYQKKFIIAVTGLLFFTPFFGPISVTIWKDSVYTPLTILGVVILLKSIQFKAASRKRMLYVVSTFILSIGAAFRHEGWVVLIFSGVMFFIYLKLFSVNSKKWETNRIPVVLIAAGITSMIIQNSLVNLTGATPVPKYDKTLSFLLDLQYVNANKPELLLPANRTLLNEISSGASLKSASTCSSSGDFFGPGFNSKAAEKNYLKILKVWLDEVQSDSRETLLLSRSCRIMSALPPIFSAVPSTSNWPTIGISQNTFGYTHPEFAKFAYPFGYAWNYFWKINGSFIGWPGLHLLIIILILFFTDTGKKFRNNEFFQIISIIALSRIIVLIATSSSQDYRYYYLLYFISLPLITSLIIDKYKK